MDLRAELADKEFDDPVEHCFFVGKVAVERHRLHEREQPLMNAIHCELERAGVLRD